MLCFRVAVMTLPLCFVFPFPIQLCNYSIYFCSEDDFTIISWLMVIITALLLSYVFPLLYWSTRSTWSPFFNGSSFSPTFIFPGNIYHCYFVCLFNFFWQLCCGSSSYYGFRLALWYSSFFSNAIYPMCSVAFKLCVPVPKATLSICYVLPYRCDSIIT